MQKKEMNNLYITYLLITAIVFITNHIAVDLLGMHLALWIGVVWMVASLVIFYFVRKKPKQLIRYSIVNAVFAGITMSAYYSYSRVIPLNILTIIVIASILLLISYLVNVNSLFSRVKWYFNISTSIIFLLGSIINWLFYGGHYGSIATFMAIIYGCLHIAMFLYRKKDVTYIDTTGLASLLMFAGILVCVITVVTEGETLSFADFDWKRKDGKM